MQNLTVVVAIDRLEIASASLKENTRFAMQVRDVLNFRLFLGTIMKLIRGRRMKSATGRSEIHNHFIDLLILKVALTYIATVATYLWLELRQISKSICVAQSRKTPISRDCAKN